MNWRLQREGLVRIQKESDETKGTDLAGTAEGTCQDTERKRRNGGH